MAEMTQAEKVFITSLDSLTQPDQLLGKVLEVEGLGSDGKPKNYSLPAGVLLQFFTKYLAGPNNRRDLRKAVRFFSVSQPGYEAGSSSLDTLPVEGLCLNATATVEFDEDGSYANAEYVLKYDPTGPLSVWVDGSFQLGGKVPARWFRRDSAAAAAAGTPVFNPNTVRYPALSQVVFDNRLWQTENELLRASYPDNKIPAPSDTGGPWKEISKATPTQLSQYIGRGLASTLEQDQKVAPGRLYQIERGDAGAVYVEGLTSDGFAPLGFWRNPQNYQLQAVTYVAATDTITPFSGGGIQGVFVEDGTLKYDDANGQTQEVNGFQQLLNSIAGAAKDWPAGPETYGTSWLYDGSLWLWVGQEQGDAQVPPTEDNADWLRVGPTAPYTDPQAVAAVQASGITGLCAVLGANGGTVWRGTDPQQALYWANPGDTVLLSGRLASLSVTKNVNIVGLGAWVDGEASIGNFPQYEAALNVRISGLEFRGRLVVIRQGAAGHDITFHRCTGRDNFYLNLYGFGVNSPGADLVRVQHCHFTTTRTDQPLVLFQQLTNYQQAQNLEVDSSVLSGPREVFGGGANETATITLRGYTDLRPGSGYVVNTSTISDGRYTDLRPTGAGGGGGIDYAGEVSITSATTLTSAAVGKAHVLSGAAAGGLLDVTLPAATAGARINLRVATTAAGMYRVLPAGGQTIDGQTDRLYWAGESVELLGISGGWSVLAGNKKPMSAQIKAPVGDITLTTGVIIDSGIPGGYTVYPVPLSRVILDRSAGMTVASEKITILRSGSYNLVGSAAFAGPVGAKANINIVVNRVIDSSEQVVAVASLIPASGGATGNSYLYPAGVRNLQRDDTVQLCYYIEDAGVKLSSSPGNPYYAASLTISES